MYRECLTTLAVIAVLTGVCGCEKELYPVGGTLVWEDGQPATELEGATIYFESTEHHSVSRSVVREGGQFQLTTDRAEASGPDGVPPGIHHIYVVDGIPSLLKPCFRRPETSGLEVTVPLVGPIELRIEHAPANAGTSSKATWINESLHDAFQSAIDFVISLGGVKWDQAAELDRAATTTPEGTLGEQKQGP